MVKKIVDEVKKEGGLLRFGESYTSLILGIVVVIVSTILLLSFVHSKNTSKPKASPTQVSVQITLEPTLFQDSASNSAKSITPDAQKKAKAVKPAKTEKGIYIVKKGDSLWEIAERTYKSGYSWVDIARVNKLSNPDLIEAGTKLMLPKVAPKLATVEVATVKTADEQYNKTSMKIEQEKSGIKQAPVQGQKITGAEYKVVKGDNLWNISVRAYGDGYQWVKIAKANKLQNPDLIYPGNKFKLPRGK